MDGRRAPTPEELDLLLDGGTSGSPTLDRLLSAARAPGRPEELGGLDAAMAAALDPPPTAATRTRRVLTRLGAATAITKIAVVSVGAAAVGGVVVAGETGHLPGQHRHPAPVATSPAHVRPSSSDDRSTGRSPSGSSSATNSGSAPPSGSLVPSASIGETPGAASVPQLCRRWLSLPPGSGALKDEAMYRVLIRVAGGRTLVTSYCRKLGTSTTSVPTPSGVVTSRHKIASPTPTRSRVSTSASASATD